MVAKPEELRNHRLIVMFFDLTSMQPEDLDRSVLAAQEFLKTKMQPADLVALVSLGDTLTVDQDFTADKNALINEVAVYNGTEGQGFAQGATANSNQVEDTTGYTPDESEYNDLNTDRELFALRAVSKSLEKITEKKSLLYFSGGISRDGIENQASLRAAINSAVRANLAIYSVDTRGLQAISPLGRCVDGQPARERRLQRRRADEQHERELRLAGSDGDALRPTRAARHSSTRTILRRRLRRWSATLRPITRLDFTARTRRATARYRKLTIKINRPGVKLEYRPGYYAPADFKHSGHEDRERELEDAAGERSAGDGYGGLYGRDVFPSGRESVLRAGFADRAGLADSVCEGRRQGQGHAGHYWRGDRRGEAAHRPCARDGEAESGSERCRRGRKTSNTRPASTCRRASTR